jgi:hypothetical protein
MAGAKISGPTRGVSPCKDCVERHTACWGNCPKDARGEYGYGSWKADIQNIKDSRNAYKRLGRRKKWQRTNI